MFNSPEGLSAEAFEELHEGHMDGVVALMTTWESLDCFMIYRKELDWDLMYD